MDPITIILLAMLAGVAKGAEATADQLVKDTYKGLKTMIVHKWNSRLEASNENNEAQYLLESFEKDPDTFEGPLIKKISDNVTLSDDLIEKAQELLRLTDAEGFSSGKYQVNITGGEGIQVGDNNTQHNTYN